MIDSYFYYIFCRLLNQPDEDDPEKQSNIYQSQPKHFSSKAVPELKKLSGNY
jgi:hypothetical protein